MNIMEVLLEIYSEQKGGVDVVEGTELYDALYEMASTYNLEWRDELEIAISEIIDSNKEE